MRRNLIQGDRVTVELGRQRVGPLHRPVGDNHAADSTAVEVTGRQFDRLARADQQRGMPVQIAENLPGQTHGGESDRHRAGADGSVGAHLLGHRERMLKQSAEKLADGAGVNRPGVGFFYLTQNLGFTQN